MAEGSGSGGGSKKAESRVGCDPDLLKHIPEDIESIHCDIDAKELTKELMKQIMPEFFPDMEDVVDLLTKPNITSVSNIVTSLTTKFSKLAMSGGLDAAGDAAGALGLGGPQYDEIEPICIDKLLEIKICSLDNQLPVEINADKTQEEFIIEIQSQYAPMIIMPKKDWAIVKLILFLMNYVLSKKVLKMEDNELKLTIIWVYLKVKEYTGYFDSSGVPKKSFFSIFNENSEVAGEDHYHWYNMKVLDSALEKYGVSLEKWEFLEKLLTLEELEDTINNVIGPLYEQPIINKEILEDVIRFLPDFLEGIANQYNIPLEIPPTLINNILDKVPNLPNLGEIFDKFDFSPATMTSGGSSTTPTHWENIGQWLGATTGISKFVGLIKFLKLKNEWESQGKKWTELTTPEDKKKLDNVFKLINEDYPNVIPPFKEGKGPTEIPTIILFPLYDILTFILKELIFVWGFQGIKMLAKYASNPTEYNNAVAAIKTWKKTRDKVKEIKGKAAVREAAENEINTWTSDTDNVDAIPDDWPGSGGKPAWIKTQTKANWESRLVDDTKTKEDWRTTSSKIDSIIPMAEKREAAIGELDTWTQSTDNINAIPDGWPGDSDKVDWIKSQTKTDWESKLEDNTKTKDDWNDIKSKVDELITLATNLEEDKPDADTEFDDWLNVQTNVDAIPDSWVDGNDKKAWIKSLPSPNWEEKKVDCDSQIAVMDLIPIADDKDKADTQFNNWCSDTANLDSIPDSWAGSTDKTEWIRTNPRDDWDTKKNEALTQIKVMELIPLAEKQDNALADIETWLTDDNANAMPDEWTVDTDVEGKKTWIRTKTVAEWTTKETDAQAKIDENMEKIVPFQFEWVPEYFSSPENFFKYWVFPDGDSWDKAWENWDSIGDSVSDIADGLLVFVEQVLDALKYITYVYDAEAMQIYRPGWKVGKNFLACAEVLVMNLIKLLLHEYIFKGVCERPKMWGLWGGFFGVLVGVVISFIVNLIPSENKLVANIILAVFLIILLIAAAGLKIWNIVKEAIKGNVAESIFSTIELLLHIFLGIIDLICFFLGATKETKVDEANTVKVKIIDGAISGQFGEKKVEGDFAPGRVISITANDPPDGQEFDAWTGRAEDTNNITQVNLASTRYVVQYADAGASNTTTITATFKDLERKAFEIKDGSGKILIDDPAGGAATEHIAYDCYQGQQVKIKAADKSAEGKGLEKWEIDTNFGTPEIEAEDQAETTVTMPTPMDKVVKLTATFTDQEYTLTLEGAKITGDSDPNKDKETGKYKKDNTITFVPVIPDKQKFKEWESDPAGISGFSYNVENPSLTMPTSDVKIKALFEGADFDLEVIGGNIKNAGNTGKYPKGEEVTVVAEPPEGQTISAWEIVGSPKPTGASIRDEDQIEAFVTMPEETLVVEAKFQEKMYKLKIVGGKTGGQAEKECKFDEELLIEADEPEAGKRFKEWTGDTTGIVDVNEAETNIKIPDLDHEAIINITATYEDALFQLTVTGGSIKSGADGSGNAKQGDQVTVTAEVPSGKALDTWEITTEPVPDGASLADQNEIDAKVTMGAGEMTVEAKFVDVEPPEYKSAQTMRGGKKVKVQFTKNIKPDTVDKGLFNLTVNYKGPPQVKNYDMEISSATVRNDTITLNLGGVIYKGSKVDIEYNKSGGNAITCEEGGELANFKKKITAKQGGRIRAGVKKAGMRM